MCSSPYTGRVHGVCAQGERDAYRKDAQGAVPEEIHKLIQEIPEEKELWIENEGERRAEYGRIVSGGDRRELIRVIKALYQRRQKQQELGKKFHLSDERFLKEAEEKLHGEFALVLNIQPDQVTAFIRREIGAEEETEWGESAIS